MGGAAITSDEVHIVEKPWGREIGYAENELYVGKIIEVNAGARLSLQYHREKDETIYILEGTVGFVIGESEDALETRELHPGDAARIKPGVVHRFHATQGDARILEVSTPHPDDVVRLQDDFGRKDPV